MMLVEKVGEEEKWVFVGVLGVVGFGGFRLFVMIPYFFSSLV